MATERTQLSPESQTSLSSGSLPAVPAVPAVPSQGSEGNLEDQLTNEKLRKLQAIFEGADENGEGGLDMNAFRIAMRQTMGSHVTDMELDMIFMKVDTNCDGTVDWEEYLTYMLLECQEKDTMNVLAKQPFDRKVRHVIGEHRESIVKVLFAPKLLPYGGSGTSYDVNYGMYMTVSQEGVVCFWDMDLVLMDTHRVNTAIGVAPADLWVTDCTLLPAEHLLVFATTSRQILIIDYSFHRFQIISSIVGLETSATCVSYQHDEVLSKPPPVLRGYWCWGDMQGGLSALVLSCPLLQTKLAPTRGPNNEIWSTRKCFEDLLKGNMLNVKAYRFPGIHNDLVQQISYLPQLGSILSCCKDSDTSLYLGDLEQKVLCNYFKVTKGITSFDYCPINNFIATGGYDAIIRVWNPYVPIQPVMRLHSHQFPVTFVKFYSAKEYIISISENKEIQIHDMNSQTCIQTFYKKMIGKTGPRAISAAFFNPYRHTFIAATTMLVVIAKVADESGLTQLSSSRGSVTLVLFNPLFHQVVSTGHDCKITVWKFLTGERVMQFGVKHSESGMDDGDEVTAMRFAPNNRRLITASRNGRIRIINFNNGGCLRELPVVDIGYEITNLAFYKQRIITAGWNRRITMYVDDNDDDSVQWFRPSHQEDIVALAIHADTLASASFDGVIFIWSLKSGCLLNCYTCDDRPRHAFMNTISGFYSEPLKEERPTPTKKKWAKNSQVANSDTKPDKVKGASYSEYITPVNFQVEKLLGLEARESSPKTASLVASYADGTLRWWSMHPAGGLLGHYRGVHVSQEISISCLVTDPNNTYLITGDSLGYIKVWDITHYLNPHPLSQISIEHHSFPFYILQENVRKHEIKSTWLYSYGRDKSYPPLLTSFRGHLRAISSLDYAYMYGHDYILSCSHDCSIRLWTLKGEFFGLYGQSHLFSPISQFSRPVEHRKHCRMLRKPGPPSLLAPYDIRRSGSSTTLILTRGGRHAAWFNNINKLNLLKKALYAIGKQDDKGTKLVDIKPEKERAVTSEISDILGKSYQKKTRHRPLPKLPQLSLATHMSVYSCLPFTDLTEITPIETPSVITEIKQRTQNLSGIKKWKSGVAHYSSLKKPPKKGNRNSLAVFGQQFPEGSVLSYLSSKESHGSSQRRISVARTLMTGALDALNHQRPFTKSNLPANQSRSIMSNRSTFMKNITEEGE